VQRHWNEVAESAARIHIRVCMKSLARKRPADESWSSKLTANIELTSDQLAGFGEEKK